MVILISCDFLFLTSFNKLALDVTLFYLQTNINGKFYISNNFACFSNKLVKDGKETIIVIKKKMKKC